MKVLILPEAKQKLDLYIKNCPQEISGLGTVKQINNQTLLIEDVFLLKQKVTGASTDFDDAELATYYDQIMAEAPDASHAIKLWWHSHVNMQTFWSKTDQDTCAVFKNGWMLSVVGNKDGNYLCRVDVDRPFQFTIDNLQLAVAQDEIEGLEEEIKAEIKEKVSTHTVVYGGWQGGRGCGYGSSLEDDPRWIKEKDGTFRYNRDYGKNTPPYGKNPGKKKDMGNGADSYGNYGLPGFNEEYGYMD